MRISTRRLRLQSRQLKRRPDGARAFGFGVRIGYWPCLLAPYLQLTVLFWQIDLWHGTPSYKLEI